MARYSGKKQVSEGTREMAMRIARGIQRPGQTKEQTGLIARGIAQGIELYRKEQKAKSRELDRKLRRAEQVPEAPDERTEPPREGAGASPPRRSAWVPWVLLALTWIGIGAYLVLTAG